MKDRVKRLINFRMDRYRELEIKLEQMAAKGLILDKCGGGLWTFRRAEPTKLTYTVTYFSEGSLFNPDLTDNQQTYIEYAKAAGWDYVAQLNQMQIFCSAEENPVPFETDEGEKLRNIKKCMNKSFIPSVITMTVIFALNLGVNYSAFVSSPIEILSDSIRLNSIVMLLAVVLYYVYLLVDYFIWCRRSARSIAGGGSCIVSLSRWRRVVDVLFICYVVVVLCSFLLTIAADSNWAMLIVGGLQMPIFMAIYWLAITYMKKKKVDAMVNRVMSAFVLIVTACCYMGMIMWLIIGVGLGRTTGTPYRTVSWVLSPTESREYKLYSDPIPLTREDLYGESGYEYYSYEAEVDSTILLTHSRYTQDSLPGKDAPQTLYYEVVQARTRLVYDMARRQMLEIPSWRELDTLEPIDNELFGTREAYQRYRDGEPTGYYLLMQGDRIISINMEETATPAQMAVIREKLLL